MVIKSAWSDGAYIAADLWEKSEPTRRERWIAVWLVAVFTLIFIILLSRSLIWFKLFPEQHWAQALLDYGIDWRTPVFAFGGNLLYDFGMQLPFKGQLLPMEGLAHLLPVQFRIPTTVVLCFLSSSLLFWCIGTAAGLKIIYRVIFVGTSALITTIPAGLSYVLWLLPPSFITYIFVAALSGGETSILCLFTAFLFYQVGTRKSLSGNVGASVGFSVGAVAPIFAYPFFAIYLVPILAFYCLGLILTCEDRTEFCWKAGVSAVLVTTMVVVGVPQFMASFYSYTFATYFLEFSSETLPSFSFNSIAAVFVYYLDDPRGLLSFMIALAALAVAAYMGKGVLRRIAIAALLCEGAIITITTVNLWWWKVPLRGDYAELEHAPVLAAYLVLSLIIAAQLLDRRLAQRGSLARSTSPLMQRVINGRRWAYGLFVIGMIGVWWAVQVPPATLDDYPPKQTPSAELLAQDLAITPGSQFRGRLMTIVPGSFAGPVSPPMFYDILNKYRRFLGNDFWVDPLAFNVPMLNEFGHFSSPITFAFDRIFFGKEGDAFDRTTIVLSQFNLRIARLVGVRMVATDALTIPGGALVYEAKAGDSDLRIFRVEDVNVGQYSPTRALQVRTAADAIESLKAVDFDPKQDVVVEREITDNLVAATSSTTTVDRGPLLIVHASSHGRSLLVLPFEFSHCLDIDVTGGHGQLLPANLQQIGLLFDGEIEAKITYRFGLFHNSQCRIEDQRRADNLQLKEALLLNKRAKFIRERPTLWR